jgi:hypothetical protein
MARFQTAFTQGFGYEVSTFSIPDSNSLITLINRVLGFLGGHDSNNLFNFYYWGHGNLDQYSNFSYWSP